MHDITGCTVYRGLTVRDKQAQYEYPKRHATTIIGMVIPSHDLAYRHSPDQLGPIEQLDINPGLHGTTKPPCLHQHPNPDIATIFETLCSMYNVLWLQIIWYHDLHYLPFNIIFEFLRTFFYIWVLHEVYRTLILPKSEIFKNNQIIKIISNSITNKLGASYCYYSRRESC